ncbi:MAG TPA: hypothetical protein VLV46_12750 [Gaiellaceae bacterium]|nr:hypothetical protein [Gaiellaceae bacterium]
MKRLRFDTTAPRRLTAGRRSPQPRPEDGVAEEAELLRTTWNELRRGPRSQ